MQKSRSLPTRRQARRSILSVVALAVGSILLTACGGGSSGGASQDEIDTAAEALPDDVQQLYRDAAAEGELLLYTGRPTQMVASMVEEFSKVYPGIKVESVQAGGEEHAQRLLTEYEAGAVVADVIEAGAPDYYGLIDNELVVPCGAPTEYADPELVDPDGLWNVTSVLVDFTAFNSDLLSGDAVPKGFDAYLDPALKGKIMTTDSLSPWQALRYGRFGGDLEATKEYFAQLKDNGLQIFTGNTTQAAELLASGQRAVYAWANELDITDLRSAGASVEVETSEAILTLYLSGCVVDAPHANAAKLWTRWILSKAGQEAQAAVGMTVVHPEVKGGVDIDSIATSYYVRPEYAADTEADLAAYNEIFDLG